MGTGMLGRLPQSTINNHHAPDADADAVMARVGILLRTQRAAARRRRSMLMGWWCVALASILAVVVASVEFAHG